MSSSTTSTQGLSAFLPVFCTLLGVIVTSLMSWFNANQAASAAATQACILRVDNQEREIKLKTGNFLSAYGDIAAYLTVADKLTSSGMQKATTPLFKAGMEMIAFSPSDLFNATAPLITGMHDKILDQISGTQSKKNEVNIDLLFDKWLNAYGRYLAELEQQRKACK